VAPGIAGFADDTGVIVTGVRTVCPPGSVPVLVRCAALPL